MDTLRNNFDNVSLSLSYTETVNICNSNKSARYLCDNNYWKRKAKVNYDYDLEYVPISLSDVGNMRKQYQMLEKLMDRVPNNEIREKEQSIQDKIFNRSDEDYHYIKSRIYQYWKGVDPSIYYEMVAKFGYEVYSFTFIHIRIDQLIDYLNGSGSFFMDKDEKYIYGKYGAQYGNTWYRKDRKHVPNWITQTFFSDSTEIINEDDLNEWIAERIDNDAIYLLNDLNKWFILSMDPMSVKITHFPLSRQGEIFVERLYDNFYIQENSFNTPHQIFEFIMEASSGQNDNYVMADYLLQTHPELK